MRRLLRRSPRAMRRPPSPRSTECRELGGGRWHSSTQTMSVSSVNGRPRHSALSAVARLVAVPTPAVMNYLKLRVDLALRSAYISGGYGEGRGRAAHADPRYRGRLRGADARRSLVMTVAIVGMYFLGLWMVDLNYYSPYYRSAPDLHRSVGMLLLAALAVRFFGASSTASRATKSSPPSSVTLRGSCTGVSTRCSSR